MAKYQMRLLKNLSGVLLLTIDILISGRFTSLIGVGYVGIIECCIIGVILLIF